MRIDIKNLIKTYENKTILDIDEITIEKCKITGITGPNGCGKTTLLNIISGLDDDYKGRVLYNGSNINKDILKNMTYVFQKPYLFKRAVVENIEYPMKIRGYNKKDINKLTKEMVESLEIENLIHKKAHLLSGGESQKVSLARALVFEPKILLLDEPTSNIDSSSLNIMEREIKKFNRNTKATIIIVTHSLEQSERLCDNIIYLEEGKLLKKN